MRERHQKTAPKVMPSILLCYPTMPKVNIGGMVAEAEPFLQYPIAFCCHVTDCSRGAVWQNGVWHGSACKQRCVTKFLHAEKMAPTDIHRYLLSISRDQPVDVSTMRQWDSGWCVSAVATALWKKGKPCSRWPHTADTLQNEGSLKQLIHMN